MEGGAVDELRVAVYIRVGSKSAGFLLPDEREAFRAYLNQEAGTDFSEKERPQMRIQKETAYIMENEDGIRALAPQPGERVEIMLRDGTYHTGEVLKVTDEGITLSRNGGEYICNAGEIEDVKSYGSVQQDLSREMFSEQEAERGPVMEM
jgi:hypothetical protein